MNPLPRILAYLAERHWRNQYLRNTPKQRIIETGPVYSDADLAELEAPAILTRQASKPLNLGADKPTNQQKRTTLCPRCLDKPATNFDEMLMCPYHFELWAADEVLKW